MKHIILYTLIVTSLAGLLTGCGRLIDWTKAEFYQGENVKVKVPYRYVRSITAYDQFSTSAAFDALWLSDEVKTAYTNIHTMKYGKSDERKLAFLRRQLEENRHYISFYVLTSFRVVLGDPLSVWSVFLNIGDRFFSPIEVKAVDLDPIYQEFFGRKYNPCASVTNQRFKNVYRVKFDAKDADDQELINARTKRMLLFFRSMRKEVFLVWELENGKVAYVLDEMTEQGQEGGDYL